MLLAASPLVAATRYTISIETTGDPLAPHHRTATVWADGPNRRVELAGQPAPFTFDVLISNDAGKTFTALNTDLKTWFAVKSAALVRHPRISLPKSSEEVRDVRVTTSEQPSPPVGGYDVSELVITSSYTTREHYPGTPIIDARHSETIEIWYTTALERALAIPPVSLVSGRREIDEKIVPTLAAMHGFPMKIVVAATRAYERGRPQAITVAATVSDISTVDAPPHAFERPAGYVNQEPLIGAPGRQ